MDNEPVTAKSLSWTYMIQGNTFARAYKDTLSDFPTWVKKENVDDGILIAKNLGPRLGAPSLLLSRAPTPRQLPKP